MAHLSTPKFVDPQVPRFRVCRLTRSTGRGDQGELAKGLGSRAQKLRRASGSVRR